MPARKLPDNHKLIRLAEMGLTHGQIAEVVGLLTGESVSRPGVTLALHRAGYGKRNPRYTNEVPWKVRTGHLNEWPLRMLRLLGRRNAGVALNPRDEARLNRWLSQLHRINAVVGYCPETQPGCYYVLADESQDEINGAPVRPRELMLVEVQSSRGHVPIEE